MTRIFMKLAFAVLLLVGYAGVTFAQTTESDMARPLTKSGSAAWVFSINGLGNFGIGGFAISDGPALSAGFKYFLADELALRAMLGFNSASTGNTDSAGGKHAVTGIGIGVGIEMHTRALYSTSPYFGAMVTYGTSSDNRTFKAEASNDKNSRSTFGIGVMAGFDWFFTKGLAVGAEYNLGFSSSSSSHTSGTVTTDNAGASNIGIGQGGNVHLVVYF